jgi:hypothetical protein
MASNLNMSNFVVNGIANHIASMVNGGKLYIYKGNQPGSADIVVDYKNMLVEIPLPYFLFNASGGVLKSRQQISGDAVAGGIASWYRVLNDKGQTLWDGSVGMGNADMNLESNIIPAGARISLIDWQHEVCK